ncbi:MAG: DUF5058 family protein [Chloroflexi bacterium]|nr:MAG: DUF5058 family protein [Chloroflexota bacterium]
MDWKFIANQPWLWIAGLIQASIGAFQAWYFFRLGTRLLEKHGNYHRKEVGGIVRGAVITSIGPILAEIFVMLALIIAISPAYAWQREGVGVGSVFTELVQVSNAAVGAGQEFGTESFNMMGFATAMVVVNVSCIGWSLGAAFFTRYLGTAREKISRGDTRLLAVISVAATLGIFGYYAANEANKGGGREIAVLAGAILSAFLFKLADWIHLPRLKEWALGIAMFGGMMIAYLVHGGSQ